MQYYKKLCLSIILFVICYLILYFINRINFRVNKNFVEKMSNLFNNNNNCDKNYNGSNYGSYNFDTYYGRESINNINYIYPVYSNKNYKNFTSSQFNYNDVYDADYRNTETKDHPFKYLN